MRAIRRFPIVLIIVLAVLTLALLLSQFPRTNGMRVSFLDVGQGDAIFIESPTGKQVLIDGGPNREVLRQLGEVMPWYDRHIDVVIATHPDADHVSGLIDVLQRYDVDVIMDPGVQHDTPQAESMLVSVANEGARQILARRGQVIDIGGAYIQILFPDRDVSNVETNTASIVSRVVYGSTSVMLTGDAPDEIERYVMRLDEGVVDADILKAGHHGSKTSSNPSFIAAVSPEYVVYSRGCDNRYGHPHPDVTAAFAAAAVTAFDTCQDGRVTFISDGVSIWREK